MKRKMLQIMQKSFDNELINNEFQEFQKIGRASCRERV